MRTDCYNSGNIVGKWSSYQIIKIEKRYLVRQRTTRQQKFKMTRSVKLFKLE